MQQTLFGLLVVAQLVPVWIVPRFVTQDGPSHLENANILRLYTATPLYREYFRINHALVPNWFGHLVEAALLEIAPPSVAEKIFIAAYVVVFALGARAVVRAFRPEAEWHAVLVLPLTLNCLLLYGFLNFCWSVCFFLFFVAACTERRRWWVVASIGFVLYFSHILSWLIAAVVAVLIAIGRREWKPLPALAPSAALVVCFLAAGSVAGNGAAVHVGFMQRWNALWRASTVVFSYSDQALSACFGVLVLGLAILMAVQRRWNFWALIAALMLALYFVSPPQSGAGLYVLERLNVYALLALVLWIAIAARTTPERVFLFAGTVAVVLALVFNVARLQRRINGEMSEYMSVSQAVPGESTLLPVQYDSRGPGVLQSLYGFPMRHAAGYIAVERRALNLDNYEAQTPLFPLVFRDDRNPGIRIGHLEDEPPAPKFSPALADSVLIWNPAHAPLSPAIEAQLQAGYRVAATSPRGAAALYLRRP